MHNAAIDASKWAKSVVRQNEITRYLSSRKDFIDEEVINRAIKKNVSADKTKIKDILAKSLAIETLTLDEAAFLLNVEDPELLELMQETALNIKLKVYDSRIVTFAPLYMGNKCINNCLYCGFRRDNLNAQRRILTSQEIQREVEILAGKIGHKRLIVVYGEHPETDINYMVGSIKNIYGVKVKTRCGYGQIRRVNVNAAPMCIEDLVRLKEAGIGTYQVFQETYHHQTYTKLHPQDTVKGNYPWRLYCMHRAFEAGIDDVGIGALFGLYDWRFEIMGLLTHSRELESRFGIGPHTISFPRMEPADNTTYNCSSPYLVSDDNFRKIMVIIRLSVPYAGMIITAREKAQIRRDAFRFGCTQTDASSCIGVGGYSEGLAFQAGDRQQFILGDTRSLEEVIHEYADMGYITSFCTAGYRCGRTGKCIMDLLRSGQEGRFCKLNAVLTFREWLDDFASEATKKAGERVIRKELAEIENKLPEFYPKLMEHYEKTSEGGRDLYF